MKIKNTFYLIELNIKMLILLYLLFCVYSSYTHSNGIIAFFHILGFGFFTSSILNTLKKIINNFYIKDDKQSFDFIYNVKEYKLSKNIQIKNISYALELSSRIAILLYILFCIYSSFIHSNGVITLLHSFSFLLSIAMILNTLRHIKSQFIFKKNSNKLKQPIQNYQLSKEELREHKPKRDEFHSLPKHPIICILDNLSNAHNVGVIIRLCEAFRIEKLYICGTTPTLKSKKTRLSSRGTEKWIDIEYAPVTDDLIVNLKSKGYSVTGVELAKNSQKYTTSNYMQPTAFVFGNERHGLNSKTLNLCNSSIHIDMFGMGNSLNVSTTASIIIADAIEKRLEK